MLPLCYRYQLRATTDECVHHAVVSDTVRHVSTQTHRTTSVGLGVTGRIRDFTEDGVGDMGQTGRVSSQGFYSVVLFGLC